MSENLNTEIPKTVWPCLNYRDARAAIDFLVRAFGFVSTATYASEHDEKVVEHAELVWPEGGGVMLGTADRPESEFSQMPTGCASVYIVTDQPDALFERATAAGAGLVRGLVDEDYGSRGFSVRDPEGNIWSFVTYRGHPLPA
ncbi:MAG TPA: VOC family protein [Acidimicrobiales bacterium]